MKKDKKYTAMGCIFYHTLITVVIQARVRVTRVLRQEIFIFHVSPLFAFSIFLYHNLSYAEVASNNAKSPISAINICLWLRAWKAITNHTIVIILKNDIWSCELQMRLAKKISRCYFWETQNIIAHTMLTTYLFCIHDFCKAPDSLN